MIQSQARTLSPAPGESRLLRRWTPRATPRAVAALGHGYAEHSGRYEAVGNALAAAGIDVFAVDLVGHGASSGERASATSFAALVDDAYLAVDAAREARPGLPLFVIGHSMGGMVATGVTLAERVEIRGLVLSGPAVADPAGLEFLLASDPPPEVTLDSMLLSRDPNVARAYDDDPLNYRGAFRRETLVALVEGARSVRARFHELTLPLLVMHGSDDAIVPAQAAVDLFEGATSADKTLRLYPELRHEIFNEPEGPEIVAEVVGWILARA